ncbi:MAG TPA: 30S ribosomal protein S16 [Anaerolineales bacterium]|nr:30S ribosomal protein S16 [Anaerolineales bacterium]
MLRIRLRREGARSQPVYRIVVAEREHPRNGRFIEVVGEYNPRTEPAYVKVNEARALHHLKNGAQPSEPVERLLKNTGTLDRLARLKKGEALEALLTEAETAAQARGVNLKTRRDDVTGKPSKSKSKKAKEESAS